MPAILHDNQEICLELYCVVDWKRERRPELLLINPMVAWIGGQEGLYVSVVDWRTLQ